LVSNELVLLGQRSTQALVGGKPKKKQLQKETAVSPHLNDEEKNCTKPEVHPEKEETRRKKRGGPEQHIRKA